MLLSGQSCGQGLESPAGAVDVLVDRFDCDPAATKALRHATRKVASRKWVEDYVARIRLGTR